MSDKEAIKEAETVIGHLLKASEITTVSDYSFPAYMTAAKEWLNKYSLPKYMSVMKSIQASEAYEDVSLFDYFVTDRRGMSAFIFCEDPPTIKNVCKALMEYAEAYSLCFDSRAINKNDHIFILEKKGTILLSVNSRSYPGVSFFSAEYIHD